MQILDNLIILTLPVLAFIAGKIVSDNYNDKIISYLQYQIRLLSAKEGVGYVAPPAKKYVPIGQPFMDKLKEQGRAIQQIRSDKGAET